MMEQMTNKGVHEAAQFNLIVCGIFAQLRIRSYMIGGLMAYGQMKG